LQILNGSKVGLAFESIQISTWAESIKFALQDCIWCKLVQETKRKPLT
jgi:hypothetical protein